jgi:hypothetical protein
MTKPLNRDGWKGPLQVVPEKRKPLTEIETAFIEAYVGNGGDPKAAAKASGAEDPKGLLADARIREAIEVYRDTAIKTIGATKAWSVMQELMESQAVPAQTRFQAARWTLEASGHGLSAVAASIQLGMKKGGKKDLSELSVSELEEFIKRGKEAFDGIQKAAVIDVKDQP